MIKNFILYLLYTDRCDLCGSVVGHNEKRCAECESLEFIDGKICRKCGMEEKYCRCKKDRFSPDYKSFCAPYYYEGSAKSGIYRFKYYGYKELKSAMAGEIEKALRLRLDDVGFDFVTFVPMTEFDRRKRGYNQSELLAREVANRLGIPCGEFIKKTRRTRHQKKSNVKQRRENLYGAFEVIDGTDLSGKTILIVDDVKTTGSTLSECASMLKIAGAGAIYGCSFCVTNRK